MKIIVTYTMLKISHNLYYFVFYLSCCHNTYNIVHVKKASITTDIIVLNAAVS